MVYPETSFLYPSALQTSDQLVDALRINPPDIIGQTKFGLIDNRESVGRHRNLFNLDAMTNRVNALLIQGMSGENNMTFFAEASNSLQFGRLYQAQKTTALGNRDIYAERILYQSALKNERDFFQPYETLIVGGLDHRGKPLEIRLTQYKKGEETVAVYKVVSEKKTDPRRVVFVGCPSWDLKLQRSIALSFRIPSIQKP